MSTQLTLTLFVRFKNNIQIPPGFKISLDYPVFAIDITDNEEGETITSFLLANSTNEFHWINMNMLTRQPPSHTGVKKYVK